MNARRRPQRGALMLLGTVLILLGLSPALKAALASLDRRSRGGDPALAEARQALIGRAVVTSNRPGSLPCPDLNGDGSAELFAGNQCPAYSGELPYRTLDLPERRDVWGRHYRYQLNPRLRDHPDAQPIHPDTPSDLRGSDGEELAFLLESGQRQLPVSMAELMTQVERRVARSVRHCLFALPEAQRPPPAPLIREYRLHLGDSRLQFGLLPDRLPGGAMPASLLQPLGDAQTALETALAEGSDPQPALNKLGTALQTLNTRLLALELAIQQAELALGDFDRDRHTLPTLQARVETLLAALQIDPLQLALAADGQSWRAAHAAFAARSPSSDSSNHSLCQTLAGAAQMLSDDAELIVSSDSNVDRALLTLSEQARSLRSAALQLASQSISPKDSYKSGRDALLSQAGNLNTQLDEVWRQQQEAQLPLSSRSLSNWQQQLPGNLSETTPALLSRGQRLLGRLASMVAGLNRQSDSPQALLTQLAALPATDLTTAATQLLSASRNLTDSLSLPLAWPKGCEFLADDNGWFRGNGWQQRLLYQRASLWIRHDNGSERSAPLLVVAAGRRLPGQGERPSHRRSDYLEGDNAVASSPARFRQGWRSREFNDVLAD